MTTIAPVECPHCFGAGRITLPSPRRGNVVLTVLVEDICHRCGGTGAVEPPKAVKPLRRDPARLP